MEMELTEDRAAMNTTATKDQTMETIEPVGETASSVYATSLRAVQQHILERLTETGDNQLVVLPFGYGGGGMARGMDSGNKTLRPEGNQSNPHHQDLSVDSIAMPLVQHILAKQASIRRDTPTSHRGTFVYVVSSASRAYRLKKRLERMAAAITPSNPDNTPEQGEHPHPVFTIKNLDNAHNSKKQHIPPHAYDMLIGTPAAVHDAIIIKRTVRWDHMVAWCVERADICAFAASSASMTTGLPRHGHQQRAYWQDLRSSYDACLEAYQQHKEHQSMEGDKDIDDNTDRQAPRPPPKWIGITGLPVDGTAAKRTAQIWQHICECFHARIVTIGPGTSTSSITTPYHHLLRLIYGNDLSQEEWLKPLLPRPSIDMQTATVDTDVVNENALDQEHDDAQAVSDALQSFIPPKKMVAFWKVLNTFSPHSMVKSDLTATSSSQSHPTEMVMGDGNKGDSFCGMVFVDSARTAFYLRDRIRSDENYASWIRPFTFTKEHLEGAPYNETYSGKPVNPDGVGKVTTTNETDEGPDRVIKQVVPFLYENFGRPMEPGCTIQRPNLLITTLTNDVFYSTEEDTLATPAPSSNGNNGGIAKGSAESSMLRVTSSFFSDLCGRVSSVVIRLNDFRQPAQQASLPARLRTRFHRARDERVALLRTTSSSHIDDGAAQSITAQVPDVKYVVVVQHLAEVRMCKKVIDEERFLWKALLFYASDDGSVLDTAESEKLSHGKAKWVWKYTCPTSWRLPPIQVTEESNVDADDVDMEHSKAAHPSTMSSCQATEDQLIKSMEGLELGRTDGNGKENGAFTYKARLHEQCVKRHYYPPTFTTERTKNRYHDESGFRATVRLSLRPMPTKEFYEKAKAAAAASHTVMEDTVDTLERDNVVVCQGKTCTKKRTAEQSAAQELLMKLGWLTSTDDATENDESAASIDSSAVKGSLVENDTADAKDVMVDMVVDDARVTLALDVVPSTKRLIADPSHYAARPPTLAEQAHVMQDLVRLCARFGLRTSSTLLNLSQIDLEEKKDDASSLMYAFALYAVPIQLKGNAMQWQAHMTWHPGNARDTGTKKQRNPLPPTMDVDARFIGPACESKKLAKKMVLWEALWSFCAYNDPAQALQGLMEGKEDSTCASNEAPLPVSDLDTCPGANSSSGICASPDPDLGTKPIIDLGSESPVGETDDIIMVNVDDNEATPVVDKVGKVGKVLLFEYCQKQKFKTTLWSFESTQRSEDQLWTSQVKWAGDSSLPETNPLHNELCFSSSIPVSSKKASVNDVARIAYDAIVSIQPTTCSTVEWAPSEIISKHDVDGTSKSSVWLYLGKLFPGVTDIHSHVKVESTFLSNFWTSSLTWTPVEGSTVDELSRPMVLSMQDEGVGSAAKKVAEAYVFGKFLVQLEPLQQRMSVITPVAHECSEENIFAGAKGMFIHDFQAVFDQDSFKRFVSITFEKTDNGWVASLEIALASVLDSMMPSPNLDLLISDDGCLRFKSSIYQRKRTAEGHAFNQANDALKTWLESLKSRKRHKLPRDCMIPKRKRSKKAVGTDMCESVDSDEVCTPKEALHRYTKEYLSLNADDLCSFETYLNPDMDDTEKYISVLRWCPTAQVKKYGLHYVSKDRKWENDIDFTAKGRAKLEAEAKACLQLIKALEADQVKDKAFYLDLDQTMECM